MEIHTLITGPTPLGLGPMGQEVRGTAGILGRLGPVQPPGREVVHPPPEGEVVRRGMVLDLEPLPVVVLIYGDQGNRMMVSPADLQAEEGEEPRLIIPCIDICMKRCHEQWSSRLNICVVMKSRQWFSTGFVEG